MYIVIETEGGAANATIVKDDKHPGNFTTKFQKKAFQKAKECKHGIVINLH